MAIKKVIGRIKDFREKQRIEHEEHESIKNAVKYITIGVLAIPVVIAFIFPLAQVFSQLGNDYGCVLKEETYILMMALNSGRNDMGVFIPFYLWEKANAFFIALLMVLPLIYDIVSYLKNKKGANRKYFVLQTKNILFLLRYMSILYFVLFLSSIYVGHSKPKAVQDNVVLIKAMGKSKNIVSVCSQAREIKLGDKNNIYKIK